MQRATRFDATVREWCDKCGLIRISYAAAKNYLDDLGPFFNMLYAVKKSGTLLDSQKQGFLDLLKNSGEAFRVFYTNQVDSDIVNQQFANDKSAK